MIDLAKRAKYKNSRKSQNTKSLSKKFITSLILVLNLVDISIEMKYLFLAIVVIYITQFQFTEAKLKEGECEGIFENLKLLLCFFSFV